MKTKRIVPVILLLGLLLPCHSKAQTPSYPVLLSDTFTFDKTTAIISWDGSDPANPPYPYQMGGVILNNVGISGIDVPFQLGYLNNGFLEPCNPAAWGVKTWTIGDGTNAGDTYTVSASTTCPYFTGEYGNYENSNNRLDGFSITATYVRTFKRTCGRYRCVTFPVDTLQGGTGTITEWDITPQAPQ